MIRLISSSRRFIQQLLHRSKYTVYQGQQDAPFWTEGEDAQSRAKKRFIKSIETDQASLTPQKLVEYLDKYVIGQKEAKRAIACAFRNRWRRKDLSQVLRSEITPKNLLIKGPTGSGKTEIARRLAKLTESPFLRVEATKYTQVGYVGKDVSTIIQAKIGLNSYKAKLNQALKQLGERVKEEVYLHILHAMVGDSLPKELKDKKLSDIKKGYYNDQIITIIPGYRPNLQIRERFFQSQRAISNTVKEIQLELYRAYYEEMKSIYTDIDIQKEALKYVQEEGIVFLDEIDKLAVPEGPMSNVGKGVSTQGVQRDLLPLIEGTTVSTKFGDVKTDHILFIASGSFSMTKIEDLIPELLGRLPIRVSLNPLSKQELVRILKQPEYNLILQQQKLLQTEKVNLVFSEDGIQELAEQAYQINMHTENLGARRLHAIIEKVIEDVSFNAPKYSGQTFVIDKAYVESRLKDEIKSIDLTKFLI